MNNNDLFASKVAFKQDMVSFISGYLKDDMIWIGNHTNQTNKIIDDRGEDYYVNAIYRKDVGQGCSKLYVTLSYIIYRYSEAEHKDVPDDTLSFEIEFWQLSLNEQYKICSIVDMTRYTTTKKERADK